MFSILLLLLLDIMCLCVCGYEWNTHAHKACMCLCVSKIFLCFCSWLVFFVSFVYAEVFSDVVLVVDLSFFFFWSVCVCVRCSVCTFFFFFICFLLFCFVFCVLGWIVDLFSFSFFPLNILSLLVSLTSFYGGQNCSLVVCKARYPAWFSIMGSILLWGAFFW